MDPDSETETDELVLKEQESAEAEIDPDSDMQNNELVLTAGQQIKPKRGWKKNGLVKQRTWRKTYYDMKMLRYFLFTNANEKRDIESIPPAELNQLLCKFFLEARKSKGGEYGFLSLIGFLCSFERHLKHFDYPVSLQRSSDFAPLRQLLKAKKKSLREDWIGKKPKQSDAITNDDIETLWQAKQFGQNSPQSLINTLWFYNTMYFGLKGSREHRALCFGDIQLCKTPGGGEYLEFDEQKMRNRNSSNLETTQAVNRRMPSSPDPERCPVQVYKVYVSKRPSHYANDPFYLAVAKSSEISRRDKWFECQAIGINKLQSIMRKMATAAGLSSEKTLTNTSAIKHIEKKLSHRCILPSQLVQITEREEDVSLKGYNSDGKFRDHHIVGQREGRKRNQERASMQTSSSSHSSGLEPLSMQDSLEYKYKTENLFCISDYFEYESENNVEADSSSLSLDSNDTTLGKDSLGEQNVKMEVESHEYDHDLCKTEVCSPECVKTELCDSNDYSKNDSEYQVDYVNSAPDVPTKNTSQKTHYDLKILKAFLQQNLQDTRNIQTIPPAQLNTYLCKFFTDVRKCDGSQYEPLSLRGFLCSFERHLKQFNYPTSLCRGPEFFPTREVIEAKSRDLKEKGKGNRPNQSASITDDDIEVLWHAKQFGDQSPQAIINTLWFYTTVHFGIKGSSEHRALCLGDIQLCKDSNGMEYLEFDAQKLRSRLENDNDLVSTVKHKMPANTDLQRCPVQVFKTYTKRRPPLYRNPNDPFYLSMIRKADIPFMEVWFKRQPIGINKLTRLMSDMATAAGLSKNLTNISARKHIAQKMTKPAISASQIIQITGRQNIKPAANLISDVQSENKTSPSESTDQIFENATTVKVSNDDRMDISLPASHVDCSSTKPNACSVPDLFSISSEKGRERDVGEGDNKNTILKMEFDENSSEGNGESAKPMTCVHSMSEPSLQNVDSGEQNSDDNEGTCYNKEIISALNIGAGDEIERMGNPLNTVSDLSTLPNKPGSNRGDGGARSFQENKIENSECTRRKTYDDVRLLKSYLRTSEKETREIECIPPKELSIFMCNFFKNIRRKDGTDYEPCSLKGFFSSFARHLSQHKYPRSLHVGRDFVPVKQVIDLRVKQLKAKGQGKRTQRTAALSSDEIESMWKAKQLGPHTPQSLINTLWFYFTIFFGIQGNNAHRSLCFDDIKVGQDPNGDEYLELDEKFMSAHNTGKMKSKIWATGDPERCPVQIYRTFVSKRPQDYCNPTDPFYIATHTDPFCIATQTTPLRTTDWWFKRQPIGVNKIAKLMKRMALAAGLPRVKNISNLSASKHLAAKWFEHVSSLANRTVPSSGHTSDRSSKSIVSDRFELDSQTRKVRDNSDSSSSWLAHDSEANPQATDTGEFDLHSQLGMICKMEKPDSDEEDDEEVDSRLTVCMDPMVS